MNSLFKILLSLLLFSSALLAQEGMWMLNQIDKLNLKSKGLKLETSSIYDPGNPSLYNAIVQIGGGSGSFVSPEGLLVTNHHVAFTAVQRASSKENDYLKNGFLAASKSEEIEAPGYVARVVYEMRDVTAELDKVTSAGKDALEKNKLRQQRISKLKEEVTSGKDDLEVSVAEMFNGKQYILFVYKLYKDVRLVYIPPMSVGNYGGETDNWMWPRHTGDFSFLRVYCSKDGKGAPYSKDNIPLKPKVWLKPAADFLKEGDFTFIMGFPGFTTRYRTSTSVAWNLNKNYPSTIKNFREIIEIAEAITKNDREGQIKVSDLVKGLANTMKNFEGKVTAMKRTNFLQKKIEFENDFTKWVNSDPARKLKFGSILDREKELYKPLEKTKLRDDNLGTLQGLGGTMMSLATTIVAIAAERGKSEEERDPGFSEEMVKETADGLQYQYDGYYEPVDKALFTRALNMIAALPADQKVAELDYLTNDKSMTIEKFADKSYQSTKLKDVEFVRGLLSKSLEELEKINDPFVTIALKIRSLTDKIQTETQNFGINVTAIRKEYLDALFEWKGLNMYPDANSTIRFTSGFVQGYKPADAVTYSPFTTLRGVVQKNTGEEPFDAPAELINLYEKKDFGKWADPTLKEVPVAFTHTCDITGGNSGSPVLNSKGEIVGLAFDGNYEGMISDWQYDSELQRTISVSMKYVCFILDKYAKAGHLLKEMGI